MRYAIGFILILALVVTGCRGFGVKEPAGESLVDTQLSATSPSTTMPATSPGEPQSGFEQEPEKSQNP